MSKSPVEMCLIAVKSKGERIQFVPEEFKTYEVYLEAVKSDATAIHYVPDKMRTRELLLELIPHIK